MNLTPEEKEVGKDNFEMAAQWNRRDVLKGGALASLASAGSLGAVYFGYDGNLERRLRVGVIGTGDEGNVLIGAINPDYVEVKAVCDVRPYSIHRAFHGDWTSPGAHEARKGLMEVYGWKTEDEAKNNVKVFQMGYREFLDEQDLDLDAVIIALPLHLHADAAIYAMQKGLHVLTEKLMGQTVGACKEMSRVAKETGMILATGHQRHYSVLYANAVDQIRRGLLGDIHSIRAQWHRSNMPGKDSWSPPLPDPVDYTLEQFEQELATKKGAERSAFANAHPLMSKYRSWKGRLKNSRGSDAELWASRVAQVEAQIADAVVNAENYGYQGKTIAGGYEYSPIEELIRWRLWERTGAGLMAELGSHQLDAASIFISAQREDGKKVLPLNVSGVGGRYIFPNDREVDDHVYCTFEFPAQGYYEDYESKKVADPNRKIGVVYSAINGNGYGGWGEVVMGTKGTLILEQEQEALLFKGSNTTTRITLNESKGEAAADTYETGGGPAPVAQATTPQKISRGYTEEIEHWAWCILNPAEENQPRCKPEVALADAVIALTTNIAIKENRQIEFKPEWFDIESDETPEGKPPRGTNDILAKS